MGRVSELSLEGRTGGVLDEKEVEDLSARQGIKCVERSVHRERRQSTQGVEELEGSPVEDMLSQF